MDPRMFFGPDLFCPRYRMSDRSDSLYPSMWDNMEPSSDVGMEAGPTHVGGWGSSIGGWGTSRMNRPGGMPPPQAHTGHPPHTPHTPHPLFPPPPHPHHPGPNPQHPGRIDVPPVGMMPGGGIGMSNMGPSQPPTSVGSPGALVVPQPMKAPRTIKTYHCRMCDQIFESKSDLLVHSQHVHKQDPKPYKCPTCNKCFANSSYLSQHARIHSGIKPYKCQICERRFTQLCHLQQHIRTHTGEKPYKCQHPGCGKAFSQLSNLQSHSRSHMTDKPYRCNSCYKCFTDEQSLREHIPKHSETKHIKTHICRICGKAYTQETYLARHMTKHTGDGGPQQMGVQQQQQQQQHPGGIGGGRIGLPPGGLASPPGSQANNMIVNKSMSSSVPPGPPPSVGPPHIPDNDPLKSPDLDGTSGSGLVNVGGPLDVDPNKGSSMSAFMPLGHQFTGPTGLMSNSVPSSGFPFSAPRLPTNTLNSPLSHITSGTTSRSYFPFDHPIPFPAKRDMDRQGPMGPISREGMMANTLLSLQQIKNFSSSHPVFPKSEPSSPVHKNF